MLTNIAHYQFTRHQAFTENRKYFYENMKSKSKKNVYRKGFQPLFIEKIIPKSNIILREDQMI